MFLVLCSAVATIACRDSYRPADLRAPDAGQLSDAPPTLLSLTCELRRRSAEVSCKTNVSGDSAPRYAHFQRAKLVRDTVAHTWQFAASAQNLLRQSIGTLDGATVTGVKAFVTELHVTAGTGAVRVANADGVGTFTAPNQAYFAYNEIVAPNGYAASKLWKIRVPNTVTAVSMSILVSAQFPAQQTVTAIAPDTEPMWFSADSNWNGAHMKRVIAIGFRSGTTLADKQLAVAYVGGTVVAGVQADSGEGVYLASIESDGSTSALEDAMNRLSSLPQVEFATETARAAAPGSSKPIPLPHPPSSTPAYAPSKPWKFNVPNTMTAVSMRVITSADFPAEQGVTPNPPSSLPAWVHSEANTSGRAGTAAIPGRFTKQILLVYFRSTATLADRQLAIAYVNGTVVGGKLYADGTSGYYAVQVADDGSGSGLLTARARLRSLPQVEAAVVEGRLSAQ